MSKKSLIRIVILSIILILCSMIMAPFCFYAFSAAATAFAGVMWFIGGSLWVINLILNTRNLFAAIEKLQGVGK